MLKKLISAVVLGLMLVAPQVQAMSIQQQESKIKETGRIEQLINSVKKNPKKAAARVAALALPILIIKYRKQLNKHAVNLADSVVRHWVTPYTNRPMFDENGLIIRTVSRSNNLKAYRAQYAISWTLRIIGGLTTLFSMKKLWNVDSVKKEQHA